MLTKAVEHPHVAQLKKGPRQTIALSPFAEIYGGKYIGAPGQTAQSSQFTLEATKKYLLESAEKVPSISDNDS